MTDKTKVFICKSVGLGCDIIPPLVATLTQFPIWVERSADATMSGLFVLFALLSVIPFFKQIKAFLKSPSVWVMWIVVFALLVCIQSIVSEMIIVAGVGAVSNIAGHFINVLGGIWDEKKEV